MLVTMRLFRNHNTTLTSSTIFAMGLVEKLWFKREEKASLMVSNTNPRWGYIFLEITRICLHTKFSYFRSNSNISPIWKKQIFPLPLKRGIICMILEKKIQYIFIFVLFQIFPYFFSFFLSSFFFIILFFFWLFYTFFYYFILFFSSFIQIIWNFSFHPVSFKAFNLMPFAFIANSILGLIILQKTSF